MITLPGRFHTGHAHLDLQLNRLRNYVRANHIVNRMVGGNNVRLSGDHTGKNLQLSNQSAAGAGGSSRWQGVVLFANLRGKTITLTGTPLKYLRVYRDAGTADYYGGPPTFPWPDGIEIYEVATLGGGPLIIR